MAPQDGKVVVVTGALGSIGTAICTQLAKAGCTVVMVVRDEARGKPGRDQVAQASGNQKVELQLCDLGSMASIRKAAGELKQRFPKIDVLINNAAAYSGTRKTTADGFELQVGINHLAPFLLTNLLEEPLVNAGKGRVVNVTMPSKEPLRLDDLMLEKKYSGMLAYGMSKACNLYFTKELAERWKGKVAVNAIEPGMVKTTLISEAPFFIRAIFALAAGSPDKGAETPVWVATAPELDGVTGKFFGKKQEKAFPPGPDNPELCKKLWEQSAKLVKL